MLAAALLGAPAVGRAAEPSSSTAAATSDRRCPDWGAYGRVAARTFDADCPSAISPRTVATLAPLWTFKTDRVVTASPAVVDGQVFIGDWSGTMYALDADTGVEQWRAGTAPAPGAPFGPIVSSAAVADVGARRLVVVGVGPRLYAFDARDGRVVWDTYLGSAARPADHPADEQTEIESSPLVHDGVVYVGMDVHNRTVEANYGVRGGVLALDAATGRVLRRFDPEYDFRAPDGRRLSGCSSVWSSPTLDVDSGLLYFATGNCPHDLPTGATWGRHVEAVTAIRASDFSVVWSYQPEPLNRDDTDFGATPNLFTDSAGRKILGVGKKNAVYYALDPATGRLLWQRKVTEPGNVDQDFAVGGFIGSSATGRGGVFGGTALGSPPYFHALDARTGTLRWQGVAGPSYAASAHVNGVVLSGALDNELKAWDAVTGDLLWAAPLAGPISSGPAVTGDRVYVGSGTSSSDACAKDTPIVSDACLAAFDEAAGRTGAVHAFALRAPGHRAAATGAATGSVLLGGEGNRLWAYDTKTLERQVVIRAASDERSGSTSSGPGFRDVNGQICRNPTAPDHILLGEDTGQPNPPAGWGYFRLSGSRVGEMSATQVGKLTPAYLGAPDNFGCGFLPDGRLVTTAIGDPFPGQPANGELLLWFPPLNRTTAPYCKLDISLATAGGIAVTRDGSVLVATNRPDDAGNPGAVWRFSGRLPTSATAAGGCGRRDPKGAPLVDAGRLTKTALIAGDPRALTPSGVVESERGTLYVSSVFSGTIAEYAADGTFVRDVLLPSGVPGRSTGTPFGLAVDRDGTLYYADLGIVGGDAEARNGTVRRIRFVGGVPQPPETLNAGLDFPDGLGLLRAAPVGAPGGAPGAPADPAAPDAPGAGPGPGRPAAGSGGLAETGVGGWPTVALVLVGAALLARRRLHRG